MKNKDVYAISLRESGKAQVALVGGKAANLGELTRIGTIQVPEGFCVTTEAYKKVTENNLQFNILLDELTRLKAEDRTKVSEISEKIRAVIENLPVPDDISETITNHLRNFGQKNAYAVRSSATAEDLASASFAGQQDSYLNVTGKDEILRHLSKCWASLFTERAVIYRLQNDFDHRKVQMAVVIQKMIFSDAAGIVFTADPVTSNRKVLSVDAGFGLGEMLVSGLVNADVYKVRSGKIIDKKIAVKKLAVRSTADGGTAQHKIDAERQNNQVLTDEQILRLERIGREIEDHFGSPQDIEWCLADNNFYVVQSRPITTLFPVPQINDGENGVYISVGHQQMMTDAMKPLGLSIWNLTTPRPMSIAGGRLFVDITLMLASPAGRENVLNVLGKSDPLIRDALLSILDRQDFIRQVKDENKTSSPGNSNQGKSLADFQTLKQYDPAIVTDLIRRSEESVGLLKQNIKTKAGIELLDFIREDLQQLKNDKSDSESFGVIMTGMNASAWINEKMKEWLNETNAADTLSQSVYNNITSEMGLALLDVADAIRPYPEVIDYLRRAENDSFFDEMVKLNGGQEAKSAISSFLHKYGVRCAGEIDITRPRWAEKPSTLAPIILNNIKNLPHGTGTEKFEQGRKQASEKERELLKRLKRLPDGKQKAAETKKMIDLVRNFAGYREYPKYEIVSRYFVYKQALLKEAERLVQAKIIREKEDIFYLTFEELRKVVGKNELIYQIIDKRKDEYKLYKKLTPPRIFTSDGEIITGQYNRNHLPSEAIVGLAVSRGIVEGRARVVLNLEEADLEEGDILVTAFTDPSWTPLFVSIKGLVTEVGGLMTHGAVIAREYGLPAVVGVENAVSLIQDGQLIRVNGTDGFVEIL